MPSSGSAAKALPPSTLHSDGVRRCWGSACTDGSGQREYHDCVWGHAKPRGSGRLLFREIVLQTFQAGLTWAMIYKKLANFEARFERWDYARVGRWGEKEVAAAMGDAGIVRNEKKIRAAVNNARLATQLDAAAPGGFEAFCWRVCGRLPPAERLLHVASRSGSHMHADARDDYEVADGVHPTVGVAECVKAFKTQGFKFLGPAAMLSFMQAAGFVNHHQPDCSAFLPAEKRFAAAAAEMAATVAPLPVAAVSDARAAVEKRKAAKRDSGAALAQAPAETPTETDAAPRSKRQRRK